MESPTNNPEQKETLEIKETNLADTDPVASSSPAAPPAVETTPAPSFFAKNKTAILIVAVFVVVLIAVFLSSCTKDFGKGTMAGRITVSSTLDGKSLNSGDLLTIDQVKSGESWIGIDYTINGLQPGESVEVSTKYGTSMESILQVGMNFPLFTKEANAFEYVMDIARFANIFSSDEMKTTLKFKCSDGSEVWKTYPVKLIVDSTEYIPHLILNTSSYQNIPAVITLNKGEGVYVNVFIEFKMVDQTYLNVVSDNSFDGIWNSVRVLPGYHDHQMFDSNLREVFIPYEHALTKRVVQFQVIGKYGKSEIKTLTVIWQ